MTYDHLGDAHRVTGNADAARTTWHGALDIFGRLGVTVNRGPGYPDSDTIRANLREIEAAAP